MALFVFAAFMLGLCALLLYARQFFPKGFLTGLGNSYVVITGSLFLLALLAGLGAQVSTHQAPPCEWLVTNTTLLTNTTNTTTYEYHNSCAGVAQPLTEIVYAVFLWVLFFTGLIGAGAAAYLILTIISRRF